MDVIRMVLGVSSCRIFAFSRLFSHPSVRPWHQSLGNASRQAEVNKHQCQRLCGRMQALEAPMKKLHAQPALSKEQLKAALWRVRKLADEAKDFMLLFAGKDWVSRAVHRELDVKRFLGVLCECVAACVAVLRVADRTGRVG
jgi:hypothetical protein